MESATLPFYCEPQKDPRLRCRSRELMAGTDAAVFRLFVTLSMYQALPDFVIVPQQRSQQRAELPFVADVATLKRSISRHACPTLRSAEAFEESCDVAKDGGTVDCGTCPGNSLPRTR